MCLAIPGKVIEIHENKFVIDYGSEKRIAEMSVIEDLKIGDYVIVKEKFIIEKIPNKEAKEFLGMINNVRR